MVHLFFEKNRYSLKKLIGRVILQPKNIVTGPEFKPLYKSYGHMPDEYERTRVLEHVINHFICCND